MEILGLKNKIIKIKKIHWVITIVDMTKGSQ